MLNSDPKLKLLRQKNYLTNKKGKQLIYPALNNKSNNSNKNILNTNITSANKRKVNTGKKYIRTTSAFLDRNYNNYLMKITQKNSSINRVMLQVHQLNALLYKLKKYDNELNTYNKHKLEELNLLKDDLRKNELKLQKIQELQDIDLPEEKISIKNFNEIKLSKEDMEKQLHDLINEKRKIEYSLKNEEEYNRTIEYMLEDEQNRLFSIKKESYSIEEKIKNVNKYQKIIKYNMNINEQEEEKFQELNQKIIDDIKIAEKVEENQNMTNEKVQNKIYDKENEVKELEEKVRELKAYKNTDLKTSKDELKDKVENAKEFERKRINDEKKCIDIIYCLYIIQKYLYEEKNYDKNKIILSNEYKLLRHLNTEENILMKSDGKKNIKEDMKNNNENNYNSEGDLFHKESKRQFNSKFSSSNINKNISSAESVEDPKFNKTTKNFLHNLPFNKTSKSSRNLKNTSFKKIKSKTQLTFFQSYSDLITFYSEDGNKLNELINKFNSITITKREILNYISSLQSKLDFYGSQLNFFHYKELNLENMKSKYDKKVKEIIMNDYFKFEELTKNNSKCKEFMEKNEHFIKKMKKNNKKILMGKILEKINKKDEIIKSEENINNIDNNEENYEIDEDNILFKSAKDIIMSVKNFFFTCSDLLKNIIHVIDKKNNNQNKTEDINEILLKENNLEDINSNNDNRFIQTYKKLDEFQKNKEVIIGDDYKLLIQYIKNLIKYCRDKNDVLTNEDFSDINKNLVERLCSQKLDKVFMKRFLAKKPPNFNNVFTHFISLSDQVMENIKEIYDLINSKENEKYLEENTISYKVNDEDFHLFSPKRTSQASINNNESQSLEMRSSKAKSKRKYKKITSAKSMNIKSNNIIGIDKFKELCIDEEDKETVETQATKKVIIKKKKRIRSIDDKVVNKLYTPFLQKTFYLRKLNPNIPGIKQMTTNCSKAYHNIKKMIGEVDVISHQMKIYNNPHLDTNKLCDNTYNSLVKWINGNIDKKKPRKQRYRLSEK